MKKYILFILFVLQACKAPITGVYKQIFDNSFVREVYQIELKADSTFEYDTRGHNLDTMFTGTWQVKDDTLLLDYNLPFRKPHQLIEKKVMGQTGKQVFVGAHKASSIILIGARVYINGQEKYRRAGAKGEVVYSDSITLKKIRVEYFYEKAVFEVKDTTANWFQVLLANPKPVIYGILYKKMLIKRRYLVPPEYKDRKYYRVKKK